MGQFKIIRNRVYKLYKTKYPYYIKNKITGEDMGYELTLKIITVDENGNLLETPYKEDDHYEYARYTTE